MDVILSILFWGAKKIPQTRLLPKAKACVLMDEKRGLQNLEVLYIIVNTVLKMSGIFCLSIAFVSLLAHIYQHWLWIFDTMLCLDQFD